MTTKKLRVLLVEASPDDARRTLAKLEQGGYAVEHQRVDSASAMQAALHDENWDVVLCSYDPSGFGGLDALKLMQAEDVDLPFLFLSHDLREEAIIHAMQSGADDYIFKDSLNRLAPAIEHNLREARIRLEHRQARLALQENQARLHAFIANLPGMACQFLLDASGGMSFSYISEGSQPLLDLNPQDLQQDPQMFLSLLHPDDRASYQLSMRTSAENLSFWNWEGRIVMPPQAFRNREGRIVMSPQGEIKWINLRCSPRKLDHGGVQWECVLSNISQGKLAEIEIKHSQEQLRELSAHIHDMREQERLNIARDVHDDLGSTLTAIKLEIAWLGGHLAAERHELAAKARGIESLVDKCTAAAANISHNLRPSVLDSFGIIAAIEIELEEFGQRTGISCTLTHTEEGDAPDPNAAIALFRIFQEALANITKHAQASQVKVALNSGTLCVNLIVSDNGRGYTEADRRKPRSFGLRGIEERVAHFGGDVQIRSTPGQGSTVAVRIARAPECATAGCALPLLQQTLFLT